MKLKDRIFYLIFYFTMEDTDLHGDSTELKSVLIPRQDGAGCVIRGEKRNIKKT